MLRITKQADYGLVLLSHMAAGTEGSVFAARDLADQTHLSFPMVGKILKCLSRNGLLASTRGVRGGYRLARPASGITVSEVISALEGPIALTECQQAPAADGCALTGSCPTRSPWTRINRAVREALDRLTLAEMAVPEGNGHGPSLVSLAPLPEQAR